MKNLKKLSALALSLMMVLSIAGCEKSDDSGKKDSSSKTETTTTSAPESSSSTESSSDTDSKANVEAGFKDGVYTTEDYTVELGSEWKKSDTSVGGMTMFTLGGDATTNINIIKENTGKDITAEEYKNLAVAQFEKMKDYKVDNSEAATINGNDAYKVYLSAEQSSIKMNLIQGYIVKDSNVFVITLTTIADKYDEIKPSAEKILESFKVL